MRPGCPTTSSPGAIQDQIFDTKVDLLDATTIRVRAWPLRTYRNKFYSLYVNGVYSGQNIFVDANRSLDAVCPCDPGSDTISAYLEDAGQWAQFEGSYQPQGGPEFEDSLSALRLQFAWSSNYQLTAVRGDSQLSNIAITGAVRGLNVSASTYGQTRGKLMYQIVTTTDGSNLHIVRFWNGNILVAEGSISGSGSITCVPINNSGVTVTATLTYSADVPTGIAFIELRWPASYYVFYSTSALNYSNPPQATVLDSGKSDYIYLTPVLSPGVYNLNILEFSDDGVLQSSGIVTQPTQTIQNAPLPATVTSVTGSAGALTVHWTINEPGSFYTVYSSFINLPANLGNYSTPAPVVTSTDATSATIPAVTGYPGRIKIIVRATQSGVQEHTDDAFTVELDSTGAQVGTRPNQANVRTITVTSGLTINVEGVVITDDASATADTLDLYVVSYGSPVDVTSPVASVSLPTETAGVQRATASHTVGSVGWYSIAVNGRVSSSGARSALYSIYSVYVDNASPGAVLNPVIKTIRGK